MRKILMLALFCCFTAQAVQNPVALNQQRALQSMVDYKCSTLGTVAYSNLDDALYYASRGLDLQYQVIKVGSQYMISGVAKTMMGFTKFTTLTTSTKQSGGYYVSTCIN